MAWRRSEGQGELALDALAGWIYCPEPDFVFYRTGSYSAVHASSAPTGCRSYYVELSGGDAIDLIKQPDKLKPRVIADLKRARVLSEDDEILFMELCDIPHAYVIFDEHYESSRKTILDYLNSNGAFSGGRWGGWNYGGMEDALLEGKAAAESVRI